MKNVYRFGGMPEDVTEGTKTLTTSELQVKSLADKAQQYKQQAKQTNARQSLAKAQQDLMKASHDASANEMRRDGYFI
jgi:phage shock protein A